MRDGAGRLTDETVEQAFKKIRRHEDGWRRRLWLVLRRLGRLYLMGIEHIGDNAAPGPPNLP